MKNDMIFNDMLGKPVSIDGVTVGYVRSLCIEEQSDSFPVMRVELVMTPKVVEDLDDYSQMWEVMH